MSADSAVPATSPRNLRGWLRLWFLLDDRVDRRAYVLTGFGLMALKYVAETAFVYATTGELWTVIEYFNPIFSQRMRKLEAAPDWTAWAMALWSVPFVWIGVSMTVRRAVDAGTSPWLAVLFFVPGLNYALMLILALRPTRTADAWAEGAWGSPYAQPAGALFDPSSEPARLGVGARDVLVPVAFATLAGIAMVLFTVHLLRVYSAALFLGAPFVLGALAAYLFNRTAWRSVGATLGVTLLSLACFGGLMLLFALEGVVCLAMALPLAIALALPGALVGRAIALHTAAPPAPACLAVLVLPLMAGLETAREGDLASEVVSAIEIDAPPEVVWEHVVAFSELPPPSRFVFQLGIAHPVRARIEGAGVGAVRRCEFSTGAFVEPITRWEPPRRLSFDVAEQPPPMKEWSFWAQVSAPHLDGYLHCRRGEFRLVRLPGGRTRLEGSTWYELEMRPGLYWKLFTDALIHAIHGRVLEHIARESEASAAR